MALWKRLTRDLHARDLIGLAFLSLVAVWIGWAIQKAGLGPDMLRLGFFGWAVITAAGGAFKRLYRAGEGRFLETLPLPLGQLTLYAAAVSGVETLMLFGPVAVPYAALILSGRGAVAPSDLPLALGCLLASAWFSSATLLALAPWQHLPPFRGGPQFHRLLRHLAIPLPYLAQEAAYLIRRTPGFTALFLMSTLMALLLTRYNPAWLPQLVGLLPLLPAWWAGASVQDPQQLHLLRLVPDGMRRATTYKFLLLSALTCLGMAVAITAGAAADIALALLLGLGSTAGTLGLSLLIGSLLAGRPDQPGLALVQLVLIAFAWALWTIATALFLWAAWPVADLTALAVLVTGAGATGLVSWGCLRLATHRLERVDCVARTAGPGSL